MGMCEKTSLFWVSYLIQISLHGLFHSTLLCLFFSVYGQEQSKQMWTRLSLSSEVTCRGNLGEGMFVISVFYCIFCAFFVILEFSGDQEGVILFFVGDFLLELKSSFVSKIFNLLQG